MVLTRRRSLALLAVAACTRGSWALPAHPEFSGTWRQSNSRCVPKRTGDVSRRIEQGANSLIVETTVAGSSGPARHAVQTYSLDRKISRSTGADGDEFYTSVVWKGDSLLFSIEEHEDGKVLLSTETWMLLDGGETLQVERARGSHEGATTQQTLIFVRQR